MNCMMLLFFSPNGVTLLPHMMVRLPEPFMNRPSSHLRQRRLRPIPYCILGEVPYSEMSVMSSEVITPSPFRSRYLMSPTRGALPSSCVGLLAISSSLENRPSAM